ncbi:WSC domain-containing protein [Xylariaceae sp. FL0662B]|nr:WSC domain-containing protein [Xylariaceae sp. FL0662B]
MPLTDSVLYDPTSPPWPMQTGTVPNCNKWMQAFAKDDTCELFAGRANLVPENLYQYNPFLGAQGENCPMQFQANYWYCVGVNLSATNLGTNTSTIVSITPTPAPALAPEIKEIKPTTTPTTTTSPIQAPSSPQAPAAATSQTPPTPALSSPTPTPTTITNNKVPTTPSTASLAGVSYLGCAPEAPGRALNKAATARADMTVEACVAFCSAQGHALAGLEYGNECFCGASLAPSAASDSAGCTMPCAGNQTQACGGPSLLSVYRNASVAVPAAFGASIGVTGFAYAGCFDEAGGRVLETIVVRDDALSVEKCVGVCAGKGFRFVGVGHGRECQCAGKMRKGAVKIAEDRCRMPCAGNRGHFCGGPGAIGVYAKGEGKREEIDIDVGGDDEADDERREEIVTKTVRIMRRNRWMGRFKSHA